MRKTILLLASLLISFMGLSQTYEGFNFKALLTDQGNPVANQTISVKVTIDEHHVIPSPGTTLIYEEEHTSVSTDANGIFSIVIGNGNYLAGTTHDFKDISWSTVFNTMRYSVAVKWGGNSYQDLVTNEIFQSVPFAKKAVKANALTKQYGQIVFDDSSTGLKFEANNAGSNKYEIKLDGTHLGFFYNNGAAMDIIGNGLVNINDQINVNGKLTAPDSGDADLKAYAYGEWHGSAARHTTDNIKIEKTGTGQYKVTIDPSPGDANHYIIIGNLYSPAGFIRFNKGDGFFNVNTYNTSGNYSDRDFTFVIFKK